MRIQRYLANDTRSAMALARAELGPNAMILANRRVGRRVELTAAVDLDELIDGAAASGRRAGSGPGASAGSGAATPANEVQLRALERELTRLRNVLESELGDRSWREAAGAPAPAVALRQRLLRVGLSRSLAGELMEALPPVRSLDASWRLALQALSARIPSPTAAQEQGAVTALFGSTGVGKTTTIAKLAGRDVQRLGTDAVGLITMDTYRIGAQEQLASFADALGLPLLPASDRHSLSVALRELRGRRVYIDTAGMGQHDARLVQQLELLQGQRVPVSTLLVLAASAQASQSRAIATLFADAAVCGAIITKVDEATSLGGVLDVLVRAKLPLHGVGDGQVVPDDLQVVAPDALVRRAVEIAPGADHDRAGAFSAAAVAGR